MRLRIRADLPWVLLLGATVFLIWCAVYHRWSASEWNVPLSYGGDATWNLAYVKALVSGDILPLLPKNPASLGAPYRANWNDYPTIEEGITTVCALLAWVFGLFAGLNLAVFLGQFLAAAAFFLVCRALDCARSFAFTGALLFAFSHYAFARGLPHISLTYYWHLPLGLWVIWRLLRTATPADERRLLLPGATIALLFAVQNIYYTGLFLQFLVLAGVLRAFRQKSLRALLLPGVFVAIIFVTFCAMNFDTFYNRLTNGPNEEIVSRSYAGMELYALKPVELFLPPAHRLEGFQSWAKANYFDQALFVGEGGSPYLGLVAICGFGWLCWGLFRALGQQKFNEIPWPFWPVLWIFSYAVVGGFNSVIGLGGMVLFRGTNRYSIVLLMLLLVFLVQELSRFFRQSPRLPVVLGAGALAVFGLWDQLPTFQTGAEIDALKKQLHADQAVVTTLEQALPPQAMIFELPVAKFPEALPIVNMGDYEHFRPYIFSHSLRFSYGSAKGRGREAWQDQAVSAGTPELIKTLEADGFAAVLINRRGYADGAASLLAQFQRDGRTDVLSNTGDFVAIRLHPSPSPVIPPDFVSGWSGLEGIPGADWRWSVGDAEIDLENSDQTARPIRLRFGLGTLQPRQVRVSAGGKVLLEKALSPEQVESVDLPLSLPPGRTRLRFESSTPAEKAPGGDPRHLSFRLTNFQVVPD